MGVKDLYLKLKAFRLRRILVGDGRMKRRVSGIRKKPSWMNPISHGYYAANQNLSSFRDSYLDGSPNTDTVVVQREQIGDLELWFFGVFDARVENEVAKYMQSHLFDKMNKETKIRRKSKETMRRAFLGARTKVKASNQKEDENERVVGSASVMVINGERLVIANMGDFKVVVCRDGDAHQISTRRGQTAKRHWSRRLLTVRALTCSSRNEEDENAMKSLELAVGAERIRSDTEFVIIASSGIWEVMKNQEAVNLIRHIEDTQQAAECLAKEALARMSRGSISCVVIRFD